ncbi:hypothetical protein [Novosphingobium sp. BW1]|uniref:hypothetical protein n=1 Tax=Novosphingobium sp. BW1 TaxID=2592621 RepID=UPI0011DE8934|nr:hypothetical protein [Novosphingobium sp. BW1]TYC89292.1 hypothetical protein FMM79_10150 [Novosphingobium sp. BW1]
MARWPQVDFSEHETVFYAPTGGVVKAREAMIAVPEAFMHKGGTMKIGHAKPAPAGGSAPLTVDGEPLACGAALFACGHWLPRMFPERLGDRIVTPRREIFYVSSTSRATTPPMRCSRSLTTRRGRTSRV